MEQYPLFQISFESLIGPLLTKMKYYGNNISNISGLLITTYYCLPSYMLILRKIELLLEICFIIRAPRLRLGILKE